MGRGDTALGAVIARLRAGTLAAEPAKYQRGIGAAEAKAVRHDPVKLDILLFIDGDRHASRYLVEIVDVRRGRNEIALHHQERINGLLGPCCTKRVAGQ